MTELAHNEYHGEKKFRILMLEDRESDADLVEFELQEGGVPYSAKRVTTEGEFVNALQEFAPDVILSDYDLPKYDGASALAEAKARCADVPFILVTGAVREDRAIDMLTSGAKDYVMKNSLHRLVPAVRRALAEVDEHRARKQAEEELRSARQKLELEVEKKTADLAAEAAARRQAEESNGSLAHELKEALNKVETLSGLLPICIHCKQRRDDESYWAKLEAYIGKYAEALFGQETCPNCAKELAPEFLREE